MRYWQRNENGGKLWNCAENVRRLAAGKIEKTLKKKSFPPLGLSSVASFLCPLCSYSRFPLNGHPRGNGKWPLKRGLPLYNGVRQKLVKAIYKRYVILMQNRVESNHASHEDDNKLVFWMICRSSFLSILDSYLSRAGWKQSQTSFLLSANPGWKQ